MHYAGFACFSLISLCNNSRTFSFTFYLTRRCEEIDPEALSGSEVSGREGMSQRILLPMEPPLQPGVSSLTFLFLLFTGYWFGCGHISALKYVLRSLGIWKRQLNWLPGKSCLQGQILDSTGEAYNMLPLILPAAQLPCDARAFLLQQSSCNPTNEMQVPLLCRDLF